MNAIFGREPVEMAERPSTDSTVREPVQWEQPILPVKPALDYAGNAAVSRSRASLAYDFCHVVNLQLPWSSAGFRVPQAEIVILLEIRYLGHRQPARGISAALLYNPTPTTIHGTYMIDMIETVATEVYIKTMHSSHNHCVGYSHPIAPLKS